MKKAIILASLFLSQTILLQAQSTTIKSGRTSVGIRAGVNFTNINGKDINDNKLENDMLTGFHVGLNVEIPLGPQFYIQPGLLFSQKGAKNVVPFTGETVTSTISLSYIEMPINFLFKPSLGAGHLLLGFGPYVALGIDGKYTLDLNGNEVDEDVRFQQTVSNTDPDNVVYYKPLDAGANLLFGYEFGNKLSLQANAQLGLTKINPEYDGFTNDKRSQKNTGFGLSLGYRF
jgi:Outer membrane protein beta-barrel domain